jgi:hypothetical protein
VRLRQFAIAGLLAFACLPPSQALGRQGLTIGFNAQSVLTGGTPASRAIWAGRAMSEGGAIVRVFVNWSLVAPSRRPARFDPANSASPGYNWATTDAAVRALASEGFQVLLTPTFAPVWAEAGGMPASALAGTWRPDPSQFASFATAAALRYSGHFPDPENPGSFLPAVRYWQPWNEPNLSNYITPQWVSSGTGYTAESPIIYRQLLNSFYRAVKNVSPANFVVTAGTAPFGDPPGGARVPPVEFDRDLFCLRDNAKLSPLRCLDPPHLDALSHHPYGVGGPLWHALNPDDASIPDMYKIARVLKAAERWRHVLPVGRKQLWDTEISWDSDPPDPGGVPINRQARWVEQTMYVLWRHGVDTVLWLQIVDSPPIPNYGTTNQGGMYFISGAPKPAAQALRFPFVTRRLNTGHIQAWGLAPQGGRLAVERRRGAFWKVVRTLRLKKHQVFLVKLRVRGRALLRANMYGQTSLTWMQSG